LLYKSLNDYFKNDEIEKRIDFWVDNMLSNHIHEADMGNFKTFKINQKKETGWGTDIGFLEGLSGIGLTLIYLSDNKLNDWKRALLL
jgi:tetrahydromethanopterin S-methyltransferase subunit G